MEFRKMRRSRQQLTKSECDAILSKTTSGTLALLGDNGYPYAVPISYVYADGRLYFHSAKMGHKVDAIRRYDKASFCVIAADDIHPSPFPLLPLPGVSVCPFSLTLPVSPSLLFFVPFSSPSSAFPAAKCPAKFLAFIHTILLPTLSKYKLLSPISQNILFLSPS